jgi:hypothetical protein
VQWFELGEYTKVSFVLDSHRMEAYFNSDDELEGYVRDVMSTELPLAVTMSLAKNFPGEAFYGAREVSNDEGVSYWLYLDHQDKLYNVKTSSIGEILEMKKRKN